MKMRIKEVAPSKRKRTCSKARLPFYAPATPAWAAIPIFWVPCLN